MACAICGIRRPRRHCPGVSGDICSICCGTEREVTVSCPLDCEYLADARRHERPEPLDVNQVPNRDIEVSESRLAEHEELLLAVGQAVVAATFEEGAIDFDVREALEGLIRTYRTLASGLYYDSIPANPLAAGIFRQVQSAVTAFREDETRQAGMIRTRDREVLEVLVFLQRLEFDRNNGRKRGRAFVDFLRGLYPPSAVSSVRPASPLLLS